MSSFIPISQPSITELEIKYVTDAVRSTWISSLGEYLTKFESEFATFCQTDHAIAVSNGTAALHLALSAMDIGPGDEVIVPDLSFIATANAVFHTGATPIFVDIDPFDLCLDPHKIVESLTPKTKAIIPVHLYGHPADMEPICKIAHQHDLRVIEDAAEAHGAEYKSRRVGGLADCGIFSFYGNKNLTTGEGGMITTNDSDFEQRCRHLRDHAMSASKRYWHTEPGFNYRLTNLQAALGYAQLQRADELLAKRRRIFDLYHAQLKDVPRVVLNRTRPWVKNCYWLVCAEIAGVDEKQRDAIMLHMKSDGVDSRPYFYPMSDMSFFESVDTPFAHEVSQKGISLPTYFDLNEDELIRVCQAFRLALETVVRC